MLTSEDGYCPSCFEGDVVSTGFLDHIQFLKCNQCSERYSFMLGTAVTDVLPFEILDTFAAYRSFKSSDIENDS